MAGVTVLYFLQYLANVQAGQKVLIKGTSRAIDTFAEQLAKHFGAEVTGVCSGGNDPLVKSLGVDYVADYTKEDFIRKDQTYDVIFDAVGKTSFGNCQKKLKAKGLFLVNLIELLDLLAIIGSGLFGKKSQRRYGAY